MTRQTFVVPQSLLGVAHAARIPKTPVETPPCALSVGDFITHPPNSDLWFRVAWRWFSFDTGIAGGRWFLGLEQADDPTTVRSGKLDLEIAEPSGTAPKPANR
jgi:hypothetical protein